MLAYEKIYNNIKDNSNKLSDTPSSGSTESYSGRDYEKVEGFSILIETNFSLEDIVLDTSKGIFGLEEENAFDGIGEDLGGSEDSGSDNPFGGDSSEDPFESNSDDPFSDENFDSPFGEADGEEKKKQKLTISREEILNSKFDMSKIVRKDFPSYILKLKDVVNSAIDIVDRRQVHPDLNEGKLNIIKRYREVYKSIDSYLTVIDSESYEDIFTTYVNLWAILNKLKKAANNLY